MATEQPEEADAAPPAASSQAATAEPPTTTSTSNPAREAEPAPQKTTAQETQPPPPAQESKSAQAQETTFIHEDPSTAPDPDEDDLSDLDDVLDEFAATSLTSGPSNSDSKPAPSSSGPGRPSPLPSSTTGDNAGVPAAVGGGAGPGGLFEDEDAFAKAMQEGMKELLGEFESNPDMARQFEELVKELGEGMAMPGVAAAGGELGVGVAPEVTSQPATTAAAAASSTTPSAKTPATAPSAATTTTTETPKSSTTGPAAQQTTFEDRIRATMERMNASSASATAASTQAATNPEEDFLAAMLRELESSPGGAGGGLGSDENFSAMLMGMMEQLTNKEILYEPMKELHDKFPQWMKENEGKVAKEDWERYVVQRRLVGEIVGKFEESGYKDGDAGYREYIVERMQEVRIDCLSYSCCS